MRYTVATKTCTRCRLSKPLLDFACSPNRPQGRASNCLACQKVYRKAHYRAHRGREIARTRSRVTSLRVWWLEYRSRFTCSRCPESDPVCIEFHHRDPMLKDLEVTRAVWDGWSKARILRELAKCDPLCANCHKKLHASLASDAELVRQRSSKPT